MQESQDRGLLDISVELSMRDIMAGYEFALFALVTNPFTKPIWIRRVHVSLPSELRLALNQAAKQERERLSKQKETLTKKDQENKKKVEEKYALLQKQVLNLEEKIGKSGLNADDIKGSMSELTQEVRNLPQEMAKNTSGLATVNLAEEASVGKLKVSSNISTVNAQRGAKITEIEIVEPYEQQVRAGTVELESSLPENASLQPGNTALYTSSQGSKYTFVSSF